MKINTSDRTYDALSAIVKYVLPAFGTLYFTLSGIWGFPYAEEVVGTAAAVATFFGIILYLAKRGWVVQEGEFDGEVFVDIQEEGDDLLTVAMDKPVNGVRDQESLNLKVVRNSQD